MKRTRTQKTVFLGAVSMVMLAAFPAFAQQDVSARLSRMENEIQTLSRALFKGETPPAEYQPYENSTAGAVSADRQAALELRLSQIEQEMATLTGRIEEQDYALRNLQNRLERISVERIQTPPVSLPPPTAQPAPALADGTAGTLGTLSQKPNGALSANAEDDDPDAAYQRAYALMRDRHYDEAEKAFTGFLSRYPAHRLADNARYWLGETHYVRGEYERAARLFAEGYQKDPAGSKGPDNLLKLGMSLGGMGKKDDACLTFSQILKDGAGSPNPIQDRAEAERTKLGCE